MSCKEKCERWIRIDHDKSVSCIGFDLMNGDHNLPWNSYETTSRRERSFGAKLMCVLTAVDIVAVPLQYNNPTKKQWELFAVLKNRV